tara:strand:+ start:135 stop:1715 length:1581 start_codon:yes stop_codon:yes gene_type:complete
MAGAKESPRQKMINLMYLVFIAMLALNMSKEVLSKFGFISEQITVNNASLKERIRTFENTIQINYDKEEAIWAEKNEAKDKLNSISNKFLTYLSNTKEKPPQKEVNGKMVNDYEVMDKPEYFDDKFFVGHGVEMRLTPEGDEFLNQINSFKTEFITIVDSLNSGKSNVNYVKLIEDIGVLFDTETKVKNAEDEDESWFAHNYQGYPSVSINTDLTVMEANVLGFQAELLSAMIGGQYKINATLANFDAYVVSDKPSYFPGSKFSGKIILGKRSKDLKPRAVNIGGKDLDPLASLNADGAILLDFPVGRVGSNPITGSITFVEGSDDPITIPVLSTYEVISKPNSASVQVMGRNTLFRNYNNKIKVSVPGLSSNKVKVSGSGVSSGKNGLYTVKPTAGKELTLKIRGTFPDGSVFSDSEKFQIRRAPEPTIIFNGKQGGSMSRSNISNGKMSAVYDPAYGLESTIKINSFMIKIGPKPFKCVGNKLSKKAKAFLKKAPKGFDVSFKQIKFQGITSGQKESGPSITIK